MHTRFDDQTIADKAAEIRQALLAARSLRLTDIASHMSGTSDASYKRIQRFLHDSDPCQALWAAGCAEPLWVMTDLQPEHGLQVYRARMKPVLAHARD